MLWFQLWLPLVLQLVLPIILLAWIVWRRPATRAAWAARLLLVALYLVAIAAGGLWLVLPWYLPHLCGGVLLVAAARSWLHVRRAPLWPAQWRGRAGLALAVTAVLLLGGLAASIQAAAIAPPDTYELAAPLGGTGYLVVNGGRSTLINAHLETLQGSRFAPFRGQSYGVDIVRLGPAGLRARGVVPADLRAYAVFGDTVYAPCSGRVVTAVDGAPDMPPLQPDRTRMAGNHVILLCGEVWVVLGHLQSGSVKVGAGDRIAVGHVLGAVGNSGNTGEPHLHLHAQRPGSDSAPFGGTPVPIRVQGQYLVRNARVDWTDTNVAEGW